MLLLRLPPPSPHAAWLAQVQYPRQEQAHSWASPSPPLVPAAAFPGQPQAVIMTSGPLKREGMLASTVSQSNVVLTPAALTRVSGRDRPSTSYDPGWPSRGLAVLGVTSLLHVPLGSWSRRVPQQHPGDRPRPWPG